MITSLKFSMNYTSHTSPWRNFHAWLSHMYIDQFKTINNRWPVVISIAYLFSKKGHLFVNFLFLSFDEVCALIRRVTYLEIKSMHSKALLWELRTSLPMFHVLQELEDKFNYYKARPSDSEDIANRGYEKVMKEYTDKVWIEKIVELINEREKNGDNGCSLSAIGFNR